MWFDVVFDAYGLWGSLVVSNTLQRCSVLWYGRSNDLSLVVSGGLWCCEGEQQQAGHDASVGGGERVARKEFVSGRVEGCTLF